MKNQNLLDNLTGFLEANIQLVKLEVKDMVSKAVVSTITLTVTITLIITTLFFANIALAYFLVENFSWKISWGFGAVALLHFILLLLYFAFKGLIRKKVEKTVDKKMPLNIPIKQLKS